MTPASTEIFVAAITRLFEAPDSAIANISSGGAPRPALKTESANFAQLMKMYRLIGHAKYGELAAMFAPNVVFEVMGAPGLPFVGRWQGISDVVKIIERNFAQVSEQRPEPLSIAAQGNRIMVVVREQGEYQGQRYDLHACQWFTFEGGKILTVSEFSNYCPPERLRP